MSKIIAAWHLRGILFAAALVAAALQPTNGRAQSPDDGRALIDRAADPRAYFPDRQPLRPGEVSRILSDWGFSVQSGPARSAAFYRAIVRNNAGQELFVVVDPYDGRILRQELTVGVHPSVFPLPRRDVDEGFAAESTGRSPGKPAASLSQGRWRAQVASHPTRRQAVARRSTPRRLAAIEPGTELRTHRHVAATPSVSRVPKPSASLTRPHRAPASAPAAALTPAGAQPASREAPAASPAGVGQHGAAPPSPAPAPAPPPVSEAPKAEKPPPKRPMPNDAGYD
jgi:hypothetical protein